jgi:hypothetical protein
LRKNAGDGNRVVNISFAAFAELTAVCLTAELERKPYLCRVFRLEVIELAENFVNFGHVMPLGFKPL